MATDSDKVLTRYTNAETIVTSDVMNRVFGGEYGYNDSVGEFDPLVAGHVHDGLHADGHASKILLTEGAHVRGYLSGSNLGGTDGTTPEVQYKNINVTLMQYMDLQLSEEPMPQQEAMILSFLQYQNL